MIRPIRVRPQGLLIVLCLLIPLHAAWSQTLCDCPAACSSCNGGLGSLKVRYMGSLPTFVVVMDQALTIYARTVEPGQIFYINGQNNNQFNGNTIYIINGFNSYDVKVNCSFRLDPTEAYGAFNIIGASNRNGEPLCCSVSPPVPVINNCPANIQLNADAGCQAVATWTPPTVTACSATLTSDREPGATFPIGTTKVTYTAKNTNNQTTTCSFNVVVKDATKPKVERTTPALTLTADNNCKAIATWTPPTFSDNCGSVIISSNYTSGASFGVGTTDVVYTAKDNANNSTTTTFQVIVKDVTIPILVTAPKDVIVNVSAGCTATATWPVPQFSDACGNVTITSNFVPGAIFPAGTSEVIYVAKDPSGNKASTSFKVIVRDPLPPRLTPCPADIELKTSLATERVQADWSAPTASDDCSEVILTSDHQPGDMFMHGVTPVTYQATDASGNTKSCSFKVNVSWEDTELNIVQLVTPDGNDVNDRWLIENIERYKDNKVTIVDRYGSTIYSAHQYDNDKRYWDGKNLNGGSVPTGTYFYTITLYSGPRVVEKRGFIEVLR